jgi:hypothetical protein
MRRAALSETAATAQMIRSGLSLRSILVADFNVDPVVRTSSTSTM